MQLPSDTYIDYIRLRVPNIGESLAFYQELLGFKETKREGNSVSLAVPENNSPLLVLEEQPHAPPRPLRTTGLYHVAYLLPTRKELARVFQRLYQRGWPFQGFADHGVSEALYLADPHGNGIELYADRPREQWVYKNGEIAMVTEAFDLDSLVAELHDDLTPWNGVAPQTRIGHIHLNCSDLAKAEKFYTTVIGFDVVQRMDVGALFVSAGGYHHHIGLNIWNGRNAPPPPSDALGLSQYGIAIPDAEYQRKLKVNLMDAGGVLETEHGLLVRDPDGIRITIH
jgi:catechol 2,3-dioxygenase